MKAECKLTACYRNGKTILAASYATPPFKVADITENRQAGLLSLMMMSSSPGILDEDEYRLSIHVEENASLSLVTQSYQRLFKMKQGAVQHVNLYMKKNATCCYLPHPVVPHESSIFKSVNHVYMSEGCSLAWGEILTCGRKMNGEIFKFISYQNITKIYLEGKLVVSENLLVQPSRLDPLSLGQLEGFTHQASLIFLQPIKNLQAVSDAVKDMLSAEPNVMFGISNLSLPGFVVRVLGHKAEQLFDLLKRVLDVLLWQAPTNKPMLTINTGNPAYAK